MEEPPEKPSESSSPYSMTEEVLRKRLNKTQYGRISTQLYAALILWISSVSFGTSIGWAGPVIYYEQLEEETPSSSRTVGLLTGMLPLGCSIGISYCTVLMKQFGPRKALMINAPFYTLTWWLLMVDYVNLRAAGRFFLGFLGMVYLISSENLLKHTIHYTIRRHISVFNQSSVLIGILIAKLVGYGTNVFLLTAICAFIPMVHFGLLFTIPESPVFLYATSHQAAAKSLAWYRGEGNFSADMAQIKKDWDASRQDPDTYRYMLFSKVVYKGLLIVIALTFFQVCTGYYIFLFYSIYLWNNAVIITGETTDGPIVAGIFILSKLFWGTIHNFCHFKVKKLLLASCFLTAINLGIFAFYLLLHAKDFINIRWFSFVALSCILFSLDMGLDCFPKVLIYEYMPFQVLKRADLIVHSLYWLFVFFIIFGYGKSRVNFQSYGFFFMLSCICFVGGFFVRFFVVEPRGKSLVQVQLELGGNPIGKRGALYHRSKM